ncbi:MAG: L-asparaginase [Labilithrix sp.]|nr:L-asparaginase [Labilithrix sp.]
MGEEAVTASWATGPSAWSILVHGGAGDVPPERIPLHIAGCERAAAAGAAVLAAGGTALDAVEAAVRVLEDDPAFNAGTGACLNEDGAIELDASIMDGTTLRAGGVCALPPFKNPIAIARRVMEQSRHVLLAGEGAVRFATGQGFEKADPASMITDLARAKLDAAKAKHATEGWAGGTVGAVARDPSGRLASATSTGGMVNKLAGRVGDSPIVGAGTYADDTTGACSTTGYGEAMMRVCLAKTASDAAKASGPEPAARSSLAMMFARTGGTGGAIVASRDGSLGLARTTRTMSWAAVTNDGTHASGA